MIMIVEDDDLEQDQPYEKEFDPNCRRNWIK